MNTLYQANFKIDESYYEAALNLNAQSNKKPLMIIYPVFSILIPYFSLKQISSLYFIFVGIFLIAGIFMLRKPLKANETLIQEYKKTDPYFNKNISYNFYEHGFEIITEDSTSTSQYSTITKLAKTSDYYIMRRGNVMNCIAKKGLVNLCGEDFEQFLTSAAGQPLQDFTYLKSTNRPTGKISKAWFFLRSHGLLFETFVLIIVILAAILSCIC